ncbi:Hint domain-containing protein [uncultured Sulfitobacter sp.]|uniref:Hint domain-containing protein n=1 Tax=uncultured Sulfitobacter sp. TaxID=191468 RepID=UPI0026026A17|nr:Hint domain-containing protein [uncultured Sulfitobacter sp.]
MIRTIDFNALVTGETVTDQYRAEGVRISAVANGAGTDTAMVFDTNAPSGGDDDLATRNLDNVLIISGDADAGDPDSNETGGTVTFDFTGLVTVKSLTFLDLDEPARLFFYGADGSVINEQFVPANGNNGQSVVQLSVEGVDRMKVVTTDSAALDNLVFRDDAVEPPVGNGIVSSDDDDDFIDLGYTGDPEGDRIDNGDALIAGEAPDDDIVDANGGDDTVFALDGDDDVYAGAGDDLVHGGNGDDLIYGDRTLADGDTPGESVRESFNWSEEGFADGETVTGFIQNTGTTNVTFSTLGATPKASTTYATEVTKVDGIDGGTETVSSTSSLESETRLDGQNASYALAFDSAVYDVAFNVSDVDGDSNVRVSAFDADGNSAEVSLTAGGGLTLSDSDSVAGTETANSDGGYADAYSPFYAVGVAIAGPVSRVVIEHAQDGTGNTNINISDVFFTTGGDDAFPGGNDALSGEAGDDSIYGEGGNDTITGGVGDDLLSGGTGSDSITGGAGADAISGGADADTILGGTDGDVVDGGTDGIDLDTLDLSGSGPLRVVNETTDADGDSTSGTIEFLDSAGGGAGSMTFAEIENLILPENAAPVAEDDTARTDEETEVTISVLANDSDPEGDPLSVTGASSANGEAVVNADGTVTFTPAAGFNGDAVINYTITDGNGGFDDAVVNVTVDPAASGNTPPVTTNDTAITNQGAPVVIEVLANDSDPDGDTLTVHTATSPDGDVALNDDGTITFTPAADFNGSAEITYAASDGNGGETPGTVTVTVRDGIVSGTNDGDLIDADYTGDPEGDVVDGEDAFLPGEAPNDDIIQAGGGNDTVVAGDGNDDVTGGAGDDLIETGNGDVLPDIGYPGAFDPDPTPDDDRDSVDGGAGNDTIRTGNDRDTVAGGEGDDEINAGIDDDDVQGNGGDDRIVGGEGNDSILGGAGADTIYAGNDPEEIPDGLDIENDGSDPLGADLRPGNGRDSVNGGAGDDVVFGADDDDLLTGGSGNDFIDGEIDNDTILGGLGADTLIGGQGNDSLEGGLGTDMLEGGIGNDTLRGNRDDDTLHGGDGDDLLDGGGQNDSLSGDDGNDTLEGATGNDTLDGGAGNDEMIGGADRDLFLGVNAGDVVDGSETGDDFDCLDLTGSKPDGGQLEILPDPAEPSNPENGIVQYFNADGSDAGQLIFSNIEKVIPCFTPGTHIATAKGEVKVENLKVGDRIITRDNGMQQIRWIGAREMSGTELAAKAHLRPVLIRAGALGNGLPERDMMVSPNHRVLVANDKTALYFEEREVLVAAKHLTDVEGIDVVDVSHTTYIHIMFDQHEVILSDGTWSESFQPGDMSLAGVGDGQRDEILELFPELATREGVDAYAAARRSLKKHEAKLIVKK